MRWIQFAPTALGATLIFAAGRGGDSDDVTTPNQLVSSIPLLSMADTNSFIKRSRVRLSDAFGG